MPAPPPAAEQRAERRPLLPLCLTEWFAGVSQKKGECVSQPQAQQGKAGSGQGGSGQGGKGGRKGEAARRQGGKGGRTQEGGGQC